MTYVKIGNTLIPAEVNGITRDSKWDYRHTQTINCWLSYEEAKTVFVDGVEWYLVYQEPSYVSEDGETVTPEPIVYDKTMFELVMSITEKRDGSVSITMGQATAEEINTVLMGG